jgi:hypothetical protein
MTFRARAARGFRKERSHKQVYHRPVARVVTIPAETDLLCEGCGYVLNGLPDDTRCPECGKPSGESSSALRQPSTFEQVIGPSRPAAFVKTTASVLLRPKRFFRTLSPLSDRSSATTFGLIHYAIASLLLGTAAWAHWDWFVTLGGSDQFQIFRRLPMLLATSLAAFLFLLVLTRIAARLTSWEAGYRGLRLPLPVVMRGLHYHAAHYLPVSLAAALTVLGYQFLLAKNWASGDTGITYLSVLSVEVIVSAAYLFSTYWTAMRNLMYANR